VYIYYLLTREAALLANIVYEGQRIDSRYLQPNKEIENTLKTLNNWAESPAQERSNDGN